MARHNPATPLPDPAHEAYAQQRALGIGPTQAAAAVGLRDYRRIERQISFKERLAELSDEAAPDAVLTLPWLVMQLKRTVTSARAANQFKNANEALSQLAELYKQHPELRGDAPQRKQGAERAETPQERRARLRSRLAVVPEAAANE